jgi:hypothetical protein
MPCSRRISEFRFDPISFPPVEDDLSRDRAKRSRLLDILPLTKRCEESKSGCDRHQVIAWAVQLHVDFADCKTSLSHHGRQISEGESEAQGTATGESQQRGSEERATGLSRQAGAEKEVDDAAKQQPWFVRRLRSAQLGRGRLGGLRQWRSRERTTWTVKSVR